MKSIPLTLLFVTLFVNVLLVNGFTISSLVQDSTQPTVTLYYDIPGNFASTYINIMVDGSIDPTVTTAQLNSTTIASNVTSILNGNYHYFTVIYNNGTGLPQKSNEASLTLFPIINSVRRIGQGEVSFITIWGNYLIGIETLSIGERYFPKDMFSSQDSATLTLYIDNPKPGQIFLGAYVKGYSGDGAISIAPQTIDFPPVVYSMQHTPGTDYVTVNGGGFDMLSFRLSRYNQNITHNILGYSYFTFPVSNTTLNSLMTVTCSAGQTSFQLRLTPTISSIVISQSDNNNVQIVGENLSLKSYDGYTNFSVSIGTMKLTNCDSIDVNKVECRMISQFARTYLPVALSIDGVSAPPFQFNPFLYVDSPLNTILDFTETYDNGTAYARIFVVPSFADSVSPDANIRFTIDGVQKPITLYKLGFLFTLPTVYKQNFTFSYTYFNKTYTEVKAPPPHITSATPVPADIGGNVTITGYFLSSVNMIRFQSLNYALTVINDNKVVCSFIGSSNGPIQVYGVFTNSNFFNYVFSPVITQVLDYQENVIKIFGVGITLQSSILIDGIPMTTIAYPLVQVNNGEFLQYLPPTFTLKTNMMVRVFSNYGLISSSTVPLIVMPRVMSIYRSLTSNNVITITGRGLSLKDKNGVTLASALNFQYTSMANPVVGQEDTTIYCTFTNEPTVAPYQLTIGGKTSDPVFYGSTYPAVVSYMQTGVNLMVTMANLQTNAQNVNATLGSAQIVSASNIGGILLFPLPLPSVGGASFVVTDGSKTSTAVRIYLKPIIDLTTITSMNIMGGTYVVGGSFFNSTQTTVILANSSIGINIPLSSPTSIRFIAPFIDTQNTDPSTIVFLVATNGLLSDPILLPVSGVLNLIKPYFNYFNYTYGQVDYVLAGYNIPPSTTTLYIGQDSYRPNNYTIVELPPYPYAYRVTASPDLITSPIEFKIVTDIDPYSSSTIVPTPFIFSVSDPPMSGGTITVYGVDLAFGTSAVTVSISDGLQCVNPLPIDSFKFTCSIQSAFTMTKSQGFTFSITIGGIPSNKIELNYGPPIITSMSMNTVFLDIYGRNFGVIGVDNVTVTLPYYGQVLSMCIIANTTYVRCQLPDFPLYRNGIVQVTRNNRFTGLYTMWFTPYVLGLTTYHLDQSTITFYGPGLSLYWDDGSLVNIYIQDLYNTSIACIPNYNQPASLTSVSCSLPSVDYSGGFTFKILYDGISTTTINSNHAYPVVKEASGLPYLASGIVTIKGRDFYEMTAPVEASIGNTKCTTTTLISSTTILCMFNGTTAPADNYTSINVQVLSDGSPYLTANSKVFLYDIIDNSCNPGSSVQCSGNGQCINGACLCNKNYTGVSCETNTNNTNTNPDTPSTPSNPSQGTFYTSDLSIQLTHIRRLDVSGEILETIPISPIKWNQTGYVLTSYSNTSYYTGLIDTRLQLNLQVIIFNDSTIATFAGERMQMEKNTLKFQIEAVSFGFLRPLQTMELVYSFNKPELDLGCGDSQSTQTDYNNPDNLRWLTNKLGGSTLISRFNQRIFVDSRVVVSNTKILLPGKDSIYQQSFYKNGAYIAVANSIPTFFSSAMVDPSIALLIDVDGDVKSKDGCQEKKKSLWWVAIIVVVPIAIGAAVVGLIIKKNKLAHQKKRMESKLNKIKL